MVGLLISFSKCDLQPDSLSCGLSALILTAGLHFRPDKFLMIFHASVGFLLSSAIRMSLTWSFMYFILLICTAVLKPAKTWLRLLVWRQRSGFACAPILLVPEFHVPSGHLYLSTGLSFWLVCFAASAADSANAVYCCLLPYDRVFSFIGLNKIGGITLRHPPPGVFQQVPVVS